MIKIKIPATTANIGPGFDCMGLALDLYNTFYIEEIEEGIEIDGCSPKFQNEDNLVYTSMMKCFNKIKYAFKGVKIVFESDIPVSRGLGSSASCILAGIIGANEIAGGILDKEEIFKLASEIEGHPDNIAPAFFGGMTVSICSEQKAFYNRIPISDGLKFCALIPEFKLSTEKSRAVLPENITFKDAVFNIGRASFMLSCLINGDFDLLNFACMDKIHQNYRGELIEDYDIIVKKCRELNCQAVFLSGAGPTIMAILKENNTTFASTITKFTEDLKNKWTVKELKTDNEGACIVKS